MLINRTEPCHHASWMKPVAIHLPLCVAVEIYSPLVALDMLMYRWPEEHGRNMRKRVGTASMRSPENAISKKRGNRFSSQAVTRIS